MAWEPWETQEACISNAKADVTMKMQNIGAAFVPHNLQIKL